MKPRARYKALWWCLLVCVGVNFCSIFWVVKNYGQPQHYNVTVNQPQPVDLELLAALTNRPERVYHVAGSHMTKKNANVEAGKPFVARAPDIQADYEYFEASGKAYALVFGKYYGKGDLMSYGRVVSVWPDRIVFDDGRELVNRRFIANGKPD